VKIKGYFKSPFSIYFAKKIKKGGNLMLKLSGYLAITRITTIDDNNLIREKNSQHFLWV